MAFDTVAAVASALLSWWLSKPDWRKVNLFSRTWMIGCQPSAPFSRKSCGDTRGFAFIMGRRKSGTGLATALLGVTSWTEQLVLSIQSSPQSVERRRRTRAPRHRDSRNASGSRGICQAQFEHIVDEHNVLLERIPSVPDVQSAWALLLHCANA